MKRIIACCVIVASLAIAGAAIASTGPPKEKEVSAQLNASAAADQAMVLKVSAPANEVTEASTPKVGVIVFRSVAKAAFGQQESGAAVITAPAGTSERNLFYVAIGTSAQSIGEPAGWENPGCDIAAGFGQGTAFGVASAFT